MKHVLLIAALLLAAPVHANPNTYTQTNTNQSLFVGSLHLYAVAICYAEMFYPQEKTMVATQWNANGVELDGVRWQILVRPWGPVYNGRQYFSVQRKKNTDARWLLVSEANSKPNQYVNVWDQEIFQEIPNPNSLPGAGKQQAVCTLDDPAAGTGYLRPVMVGIIP